ncbi:ferritin-like domain-containing protein [Urechidicola croceus]|uniref:DUF2383 domain-containing protein n=1 Tax=Urechidicola croceus TaxID=1850246 RepID=A0A1D8P457_9FLAO|nr:PA2169 family four-helix-bundle protein [Urechidicola croceus]AOW19306.1 hypothetical protein LPB138_00795 [Urechidicola croceus]
MLIDNKKISSKLNNLLEKNYDAESGFKKAAENTDINPLKTYFNRKSEQSRDFGHQLKTEIKALGYTPEKGGSVTGDLHKTWMDIKSFFTSDNEESMLQEAIRGEEAMLSEYEDVLSDTLLPVSIVTILNIQKNTIQKDLDRIKRLESIS